MVLHVTQPTKESHYSFLYSSVVLFLLYSSPIRSVSNHPTSRGNIYKLYLFICVVRVIIMVRGDDYYLC